jgi:hypothetical protein
MADQVQGLEIRQIPPVHQVPEHRRGVVVRSMVSGRDDRFRARLNGVWRGLEFVRHALPSSLPRSDNNWQSR